jgi:hypothetical protein
MNLRLHKSHMVSSHRAGVLLPFGRQAWLLRCRSSLARIDRVVQLEAYAMRYSPSSSCGPPEQASVAVMASVQMIELPGDTGFGDRGKRIETPEAEPSRGVVSMRMVPN